MDSSILIPDALHLVHHVEVCTARFLVRGNISGPYRRTSDLLNNRDDDFLIVDDPVISPASQSGEPQQLTSSLLLGRHAIHFVSLLALDATGEEQDNLTTTQNLSRDFVVTKRALPCYVLTDTYIIHGACHMVPDVTLKQYLETSATFISITQPTIYLATHTSTSWQRELVIVNKEKIEGMYLEEPNET